ncbi:MAG: CsbD family protein [Caldilineaceae bacterium]
MNENILQGKWMQIKGGVRQQWGKLTHDDLDWVQGNYEQLLGLIQERYGFARDKAKAELDQFLQKHQSNG